MSAQAPLDGLLVIDLSRALAGPHAAMLLGDLGARVIKVESPIGGDEARSWGPPFVGVDSAESTYFLSCNRNKESVTADLKSEAGHRLLIDLVKRADVLIENFRPGVLDRLGFPVDRLQELNPRLVLLSITGFGHDGPSAQRPGYDQILQGEAGLMSLTGPSPDEPQRVGVPIGDVVAGIYGAYGVLAAIQARQRTGVGDVVRTSLLAAIVGIHAFQGTRYTVAGEVGRASGNQHPTIAPYGLFRCRGGTIQLAVANDRLWARLCDALQLTFDDSRFATNALRVTYSAELCAIIEQALAVEGPAHWLEVLSERGIPCGEVKTLDQVYEDAQVLSQGLVIPVEHATLGQIRIPGPAVRFERHGRESHSAPPTLGAQNESIRTWLADGSEESTKPTHGDPPMPPTSAAPPRRWPRSVYGAGIEPDPRFTLANERTFLAWMRTVIAILAASAAIGTLPLGLPDEPRRAMSLVLAAGGLVSTINAWRSWARTERALRLGDPLPSTSAQAFLVAVLAAVAVLFAVTGLPHG